MALDNLFDPLNPDPNNETDGEADAEVENDVDEVENGYQANPGHNP